MKYILILLLFLQAAAHPAQNSTQTTANSDEANKWWGEAKERGQKFANLKKQRYEARQKVFARIREQVENKMKNHPNSNYDILYDSLRLQAEPELIAINREYDPQVVEAQNQYVSFLQKGKPSDGEIQAASMQLRPIILYQEKAKYTKAARQNRVQGTVLVSVVFASDGQIKNIQVKRGLPDGMDDEAIKAAQEIVFLPALKNGSPVSVRMSIEFTFNLI